MENNWCCWMLTWMQNMRYLSNDNDIDYGGLLRCFFREIELCNLYHLETVRKKKNHKMGYPSVCFSSSSYTNACCCSRIARRVKNSGIAVTMMLVLIFTHMQS